MKIGDKVNPKKHSKFTPPKTKGWIPKMMGLGKGSSLKKWQLLVSMLDFWGV